MRKEGWLNIIGIVFILLFLYNLANQFFSGELIEIFWLCNHVPLIVGIAILIRDQKIAVAEFSLLFFASFVWVIDLIFLFSTGSSIIGNISFFYDQNIFYQISTVLIHASFIPLSLAGIFLIGKRVRGAWIVGLAHWAILIPIAYYFRKYNFNCMIDSCITFIPTFNLHVVLAILVYSLLIAMVSYLTNKILST